ncbi:MAG: GrpB family protein [Oscillospiraceae bacterium]|jgi:aminoglycoside phosphotransferase (APT) family kinase protein/GrpB-like predicted nucleotidyltransferase (UPF0157 family)|nr:GrpB family protein [Oscillospiraceae bacterium]
MAIGLRRGTVELAAHDPAWESIARETIGRLWHILGNAAADIQHVGSTSVPGIKAKPIIDLAVAADDFDAIRKLTPALEAGGFQYRKMERGTQLLFAVGDYASPGGLVTHFLHVVQTGGAEWRNYINFRDYLKANAAAAKAYEALKVRLAAENPNDPGREKYLAGKHDFITQTLAEAQIWAEFGGRFTGVAPIAKGWSEDTKYCVTQADGTKRLLRITPVVRHEKKNALFQMLERVAALGTPMCQLTEHGACADGIYALYDWIDGEDVETALPHLPAAEQYALGVKSGEILRTIHTIPAPESQEDWAVRFNRKTDHKIKTYGECGLRFAGDAAVIAYIEQNRQLLEGRPQCFQHGDYHTGNMMLEDGALRIIDFDRYDFGDPWEEFNRIVWSAAASPHFATGQLRGYFGGEPPLAFFQLLAFYIASNTLSSIYWAIPFGQAEIDTMMQQTQSVLAWYDDFRRVIPTWYLQDFCV